MQGCPELLNIATSPRRIHLFNWPYLFLRRGRKGVGGRDDRSKEGAASQPEKQAEARPTKIDRDRKTGRQTSMQVLRQRDRLAA